MSTRHKTFDIYWSPEGRRIATVKAKDSITAKRKTPQPYRRYMGEIYVTEIDPATICVHCSHADCPASNPHFSICHFCHGTGRLIKYGEPTCPGCGNTATDNSDDCETCEDMNNEILRRDYHCHNARCGSQNPMKIDGHEFAIYCFNSDEAYSDEPISHIFEDAEYSAHHDSDVTEHA